jgi:hypothetical protein
MVCATRYEVAIQEYTSGLALTSGRQSGRDDARVSAYQQCPLPLLRYLVERSQCHILVGNDEGYLNQV